MFRIGDFSKLTQVSIRMLRYYDNTNLFKPHFSDETTGYRYYSASQIPTISLIVSLRDMGFSVAEIKEVCHYNSLNDLKSLLTKRKSEVENSITEQFARLKQINDFIANINKERVNMNYNVQLKCLPSYKVVSLRELVEDYSQEGMLWGKLGEFAEQNRIKLKQVSYTVYHDRSYKEKNIDIEVMIGVDELGESQGEFVFKETEPVNKVASILVSGDYTNLKEAYAYLAKWIEDNNYTINGIALQSCLKGPHNANKVEDYLTELLMPIC